MGTVKGYCSLLEKEHFVITPPCDCLSVIGLQWSIVITLFLSFSQEERCFFYMCKGMTAERFFFNRV